MSTIPGHGGGPRQGFLRSFDVRQWSNDQMRLVAPRLRGCRSIVNVSGWRDADKEGGFYREYFPWATRYELTNHPKDLKKGVETGAGIPLDLDEGMPDGLAGTFDLAINHTVLEHVRHPWRAFASICSLASRAVLTVVPFKQALHFEPGNFGDYHRFTPLAMRDLHTANGMTVVYEACSRPGNSVYLFYIGVRRPEEFAESAPELLSLEQLNHRLGDLSATDLALRLVARALRKLT